MTKHTSDSDGRREDIQVGIDSNGRAIEDLREEFLGELRAMRKDVDQIKEALGISNHRKGDKKC